MRASLLICLVGYVAFTIALVAPAVADPGSGTGMIRNNRTGAVTDLDTGATAPAPSAVPQEYQAVQPRSYAEQAGAGIGALLNIKQRAADAEAAREVKDRQRYEALRRQDPAAAVKELEAQRLAREERRRNRPVVTNCNAWAPGYATCITK